MNRWVYNLSFAIIDWVEATLRLLTFGQWQGPGWVMRFASWYALRHITKEKA